MVARSERRMETTDKVCVLIFPETKTTTITMNNACLRFIVFSLLTSAVISQTQQPDESSKSAQQAQTEYDIKMSHCESFGDGKYHLIMAAINSSRSKILCSAPLSQVDFTLTAPGGSPTVLCSQSATVCNLTFNLRRCRCSEQRPDGLMVFEMMYRHPTTGSIGDPKKNNAGTLTVVTNCASMTISGCGNDTSGIFVFKEKGLSVIIFTVVVGVCLGVIAAVTIGINTYCRRQKQMAGAGAVPAPSAEHVGPGEIPGVIGPPEISEGVSSGAQSSSATPKPSSPEGSEFSDASSAQLGSEVDDDTSTVA